MILTPSIWLQALAARHGCCCCSLHWPAGLPCGQTSQGRILLCDACEAAWALFSALRGCWASACCAALGPPAEWSGQRSAHCLTLEAGKLDSSADSLTGLHAQQTMYASQNMQTKTCQALLGSCFTITISRRHHSIVRYRVRDKDRICICGMRT